MKYLEEPKLTWINSMLDHCEVSDRLINGRIESYSCKMAKTDKKLAKVIENQYKAEIATSPIPLGTSPLGSMTDSGSRRLLINLISTMNASFPDYDFSNVRPSQFCKEANVKLAMHSINNQLAEMVEFHSNGFLEQLWSSIKEVVSLDQCEIYSYIPDMDSDPFSEGTLWSFNYFFYDKNVRKIVYFTCMSRSKFYGNDGEYMDDEDTMDEMDGMDLTESLDWDEEL